MDAAVENLDRGATGLRQDVGPEFGGANAFIRKSLAMVVHHDGAERGQARAEPPLAVWDGVPLALVAVHHEQLAAQRRAPLMGAAVIVAHADIDRPCDLRRMPGHHGAIGTEAAAGEQCLLPAHRSGRGFGTMDRPVLDNQARGLGMDEGNGRAAAHRVQQLCSQARAAICICLVQAARAVARHVQTVRDADR